MSEGRFSIHIDDDGNLNVITDKGQRINIGYLGIATTQEMLAKSEAEANVDIDIAARAICQITKDAKIIEESELQDE